MSSFFRFPHTPHIAWLGEQSPRDDKVLSQAEVTTLLESKVVVEEKLDGANLGFSVDDDGNLQVQNRGQYLKPPYTGQFEKLNGWLEIHRDNLFDVLATKLVIFGEWCAARHSLYYDRLPDWFLIFDIYDLNVSRFFSTNRRDALANDAGIKIVPEIFRGHLTLAQLKDKITSTQSKYRDGPLEGVVIRKESPEWLELRAKLVRPDFTQAIDVHWRKRSLEFNRLNYR